MLPTFYRQWPLALPWFIFAMLPCELVRHIASGTDMNTYSAEESTVENGVQNLHMLFSYHANDQAVGRHRC